MDQYILTEQDVDAINRLIAKGGEKASLLMNRLQGKFIDFEAGILGEGWTPVAYGSGKTIVDAVNEAIGAPKK